MTKYTYRLNRYRFFTFLLNYSIVIIFTLLSTNKTIAQYVSDKLSSTQMSSQTWHFTGHLGQYIDRISEERILNSDNWKIIYPETEEAFRLRDDDKNYPKSGVWSGEFWGKYMLAAIAACKYYHSDELKGRIEKAVKGLLSTQDNNGYIGVYSHSNFVEGNNWNVWSRKYTLWGLIESWELIGDKTILTSAMKFADQLISEVGPGSVDIVKTGNFYGLPSCSILQPMVKLYNATGQKKYLDYAEYIVLRWSQQQDGVPDILNKGLDGLPVNKWFPKTDPNQWAKGYEFTSCVEGLVELYKVTGKQQYFKAAENIHANLVKWERTPVGSVSFDDKYVGSAGIINTVSEICDLVYWNRLSYELFKLTGNEKYIDEIERTLYNSMLCAFNPEGNWGLRRLRMSNVHIPAHNHFLKYHQCCVDNLPRGLFQAAEATLTSNNGNVYYSLFNEGEGDAKLLSGKKVHVKTVGDFIGTGSVKTTLSLAHPENFAFVIRMPRWSQKTTIKINGITSNYSITDNWMPVKREWKNGDVIEIKFDMNIRWERFDPTKFPGDFHDLGYYEDKWAKLKFIKGSYDVNNKRYEHVVELSPKDALPSIPAVTFFYGPLALARDIRISGSDVFSSIADPDVTKKASVHIINSPSGIWKSFKIDFGNGESEKFCDFSSAGNTWDKSSLFNTWCILKK